MTKAKIKTPYHTLTTNMDNLPTVGSKFIITRRNVEEELVVTEAYYHIPDGPRPTVLWSRVCNPTSCP